jgi:hypothetical protein
MADDPTYIAAWERYRLWARLRLVAFLGYLPFAVGMDKLSRWLGVASIAMPFVVAWFLFVGVTLVGAGAFRCPRCKEAYFYTCSWKNPLSRHCLHCGLPKWAKCDSRLDT